MTRLVTRCLASVATVVVLACGCTPGDSSEPSAEPTPTTPPPSATPPPAAPTRDTCYRLTYDEALAPTSDKPGVACSKPHTSQSYAVGRLDMVLDGHLLAVDSTAVQQQVAKRCPRHLAAYLGATPDQLHLSLLRPVWFTPSIEQSDAGASWFRCDVIAVTGDDAIAGLTGDLEGVLSKDEGRTAYGMCGTAQPGTADFRHVLCREEHSWRAISTVDLTTESADGSYPGEDVVMKAGESPCQDAARATAEDALDYEWGYEWPTSEQWAAGQDYGRCWAPD